MEHDLRQHLDEMENRIAAHCAEAVKHQGDLLQARMERIEQKIDLKTLAHDRELRDARNDTQALWGEVNSLRKDHGNVAKDAAITKGKVAGFAGLGGAIIAAVAEALRHLAGRG